VAPEDEAVTKLWERVFVTVDLAVELCRNAVLLGLLIALPVLAAAMLVGLVVSIGQAVTQLQEQTISFVPKLVAMVVVTIFALPWAFNLLIDYARDLFQSITIGP
jgi:flagellar biosynthetic protein FliQ